MHGFFVFAAYYLFSEKFAFAIIFLSLCVNFKQMGLYYALLFPFYVLKNLFFSEPKKNYFISLFYIIFYGIITILINGIIYYPWIKSSKLKDVFNRIFPVKRGIFEDKVATFWCVLNVFIKLNKKFDTNFLVKLSLLFTLFFSLFPIFSLFKANKLTKKICMQCFFIISLAFYLFSFHVHEKTIIVPFLAFLLNLPYMKNIMPSFTLIGMFSLFPLLKRENQIIPYYLTNIIFYLFAKFGNKLITTKKGKNEDRRKYLFIELTIFIIMIIYHIIEYIIPPPEKYPWFYPMINAMLCFIFFFGLFIYSNYSLFKIIYQNKKI
jgi:alpha-1,3-glucosyltransferase